MSEIQGLGYIGVEVADVDAFEAFATNVLGIEAVGRSDAAARFRWDIYASRLTAHAGPSDDIAYAGWEVAGAGQLRALGERLRAAGCDVTAESAAFAAERNVCELISFRDPEGVRHEAFYGPLLMPETPFVSPRGIRGFVTGAQGCGHLVLGASDPAGLVEFFVTTLGFRVSDYIDVRTPVGPLHLTFLHCSSRHHSIAIAPRLGPGPRLHHIMLEAIDLDDVGSTYDAAQEHGHPIAMSLGRHTNDNMLSFYVETPARFLIEYGWGGLQIDDDATWHVRRFRKTSSWGHVPSRRPGPPVSGPPEAAVGAGAAR